MSLDNIKTQIEEKIQKNSHIKMSVCFDMGSDGVLYVDTNETPAVITTDEREVEVTLKVSKDVVDDILSKKQDPRMAFMTGKLKVEGSMGSAMKLTSIL